MRLLDTLTRSGLSEVIVAGYGHLAFRDPAFHAQLADLLVPCTAPACSTGRAGEGGRTKQ
jgi:hypothetical protein